ncbi:hypothetical protein GCM10010495_16270 [Kitasatospora herbaricolor]|uniref:hypothetical protein n=1 Tax=Kitasatospora herbaricolor TaxID=68217 RepID=UPI0019A9E4CD|nr:hypothetical protein [Kitasatospora herbaricolor]MDQ0308085.1 hypothetical protein [Kitasatospora herbaricolor]GGV05284.1 hypothetical protein GCM10010495_16270 [Kitasatospora herbaricolor]
MNSTLTARRSTADRSTADRTDRTGTDRRAADADNLAVASFLLGLPGLLLFNIALGPLAIVLAVLALVRGTTRRGRALLGLTLGVADLAVLAAATLAGHGQLWHLG